MRFDQLPRLEFFSITDEFGEAFFMKRSDVKAICIESNDGTYEKGREYAFLEDQTIKLD